MPTVKTTVNVEVDADFQVWCSECGAGLCANVSNRRGKGDEFTIEPCEKCLANVKDDGYGEGYDEGVKDGHADGVKEGYADGLADGRKEANNG
jgi:hypothetical protein